MQSATQQDQGSIHEIPYYVSNTDLHLIPEKNCAIDGKGVHLDSVLTDIDGQTRDANPDIGADEFTSVPITVTLGNDQAMCYPSFVTLDAGNPVVNYIWRKDSSTDTLATTQTLTVDTTGAYNVIVANGNCTAADTVNIFMHLVSSTTLDYTICNGDSLLAGGTYQKNTGIYFDTLHTFLGCDSIIVTNLTVHPAITGSQTLTLCAGESVTVGTNTYTATGIYTDVLTAVNGCDSTVTTNLTVNPAITGSQTLILCAGESVTVGTHTYDSTGIYNDTLTAINGCDSTVTTNLIINTLPNAGNSITDSICSYITQFDLFAALNGTPDSNGIWIDVNNTGALTAGIFNPSIPSAGQSYDFTYIVSGTPPCNDAQSTVTVFVDICDGINTINIENINIYPNPTKDLLNIITTGTKGDFSLSILNIDGREIFNEKVLNSHVKFDFRNYPKGIYFVKVQDGNTVKVERVVVL